MEKGYKRKKKRIIHLVVSVYYIAKCFDFFGLEVSEYDVRLAFTPVTISLGKAIKVGHCGTSFSVIL